MNAARFARSLVEDGVDPKLAQSLAEHLADEIDRTVATKEHVEMVVTREVQQLRVEMVVTREVQQLRVEMHEYFARLNYPTGSAARPPSEPAARTTSPSTGGEPALFCHIDAVEQAVLAKMDETFHRNMFWVGLLYLAMLGNIIQDFLR
jgi:hypothetical protein